MNAAPEVSRETWDAIYQLFCGIPLGTTTWDVVEALAGEPFTDPESACIEKERVMVLLDELDEIDSRARVVLSRLYGLDGGEPMSHAQVGNLLNLTDSVVRRIEAHSLATLRPLLSEVA
jgi:DNA-directed RNA polymerase sigma subunit (sigma70/sigma32)